MRHSREIACPTNLNENATFSIPLVGYGDAILFNSQHATQIKIITSDYQIVTAALKKVTKSGALEAKKHHSNKSGKCEKSYQF